jgi:Domain of unknown function (DUF5753)
MWGDGAVPRWFEDWLNMELVASTLRTWQPLLIPGLLQTADYARAMYGADMSMRSYICVQVVPSSTGAHAGLSCAFHIASAHGKRDLLYMEAVEGVTEERSALVSKAALIFDLVRSDALARSASRDLILKVAEERWNT